MINSIPIYTGVIEIPDINDREANSKLAHKIIEVSILFTKEMIKDAYCSANEIEFRYLLSTIFHEKSKSYVKEWKGTQVAASALMDELYVSQFQPKLCEMISDIPNEISNYKHNISLHSPELTKIRATMLLNPIDKD